MAERRALTRQIADRYRKAPKRQKQLILDELCALTGWHRDHARRALREVWLASKGTLRRRRKPVTGQRLQVYDDRVIGIVRMAWANLDGPCGKRLAPALPDLVSALERHGELRVSAEQKALLHNGKGRSGTKPEGLTFMDERTATA